MADVLLEIVFTLLLDWISESWRGCWIWLAMLAGLCLLVVVVSCVVSSSG